jgi:hypothetical protein
MPGGEHFHQETTPTPGFIFTIQPHYFLASNWKPKSGFSPVKGFDAK